jgi:hypothetical protein
VARGGSGVEERRAGFGSFPGRSQSGGGPLVVSGTVRLGKRFVFVRVFGESCVRSIITTSFVCMDWSETVSLFNTGQQGIFHNRLRTKYWLRCRGIVD